MAVAKERLALMAAVDDHVAWHVGRPEREKVFEAERP
jgi:hypothetical protein